MCACLSYSLVSYIFHIIGQAQTKWLGFALIHDFFQQFLLFIHPKAQKNPANHHYNSRDFIQTSSEIQA